jgi:uncharacterized membrane protein YfcA
MADYSWRFIGFVMIVSVIGVFFGAMADKWHDYIYSVIFTWFFATFCYKMYFNCKIDED